MPRFYFEEDDYDFPEYVPVGERRRRAQQEADKLGDASPVVISGSQIAKTFWGKSWCRNLEGYSDFANRLPRGRSYARSGCVVDLKISAGAVKARVSGSRLYTVEVKVAPIPKTRWKAVRQDCTGKIDSLVELLEGRFSKTTMERLCQQKTGLFPTPSELKFRCDCPDSARMCKHIAAVLYGIGARLDEKPELLFHLREVNQEDLITHASKTLTKPKSARILESENLSELFEIDIVQPKRKRSR